MLFSSPGYSHISRPKPLISGDGLVIPGLIAAISMPGTLKPWRHNPYGQPAVLHQPALFSDSLTRMSQKKSLPDQEKPLPKTQGVIIGLAGSRTPPVTYSGSEARSNRNQG